ncbi:MAG: chemotaxis protein CheW [Candidatus Acidiferrales bacterium]|jgi:chemotaxis signal transduction protein
MSAAENHARKSWVLLHVGNRRFALPAESVMELAPPVRLHNFPHTSRLIAGVIVRRGRIVPVYDVSPILCGRESSVHRFYLIAERTFGNASEASAIPVNGECELATSEMQPPQENAPPYFAGVLATENENIDVLDLQELVSAGMNSPATGNHAEPRP